MDPKHFEIKEYMIIWRQLEIQNFNGITAKVRAIVRCTGGDYGMDVFFLSEDSAYPDPSWYDRTWWTGGASVTSQIFAAGSSTWPTERVLQFAGNTGSLHPQ